jgi:hypothetical protein
MISRVVDRSDNFAALPQSDDNPSISHLLHLSPVVSRALNLPLSEWTYFPVGSNSSRTIN